MNGNKMNETTRGERPAATEAKVFGPDDLENWELHHPELVATAGRPGAAARKSPQRNPLP